MVRSALLPSAGRVSLAALALGLAAAAGCSKPAPPPPASLQAAGDAGTELVVGPRRAAVPAGDLDAGATPPVSQDEAGKRFAYATASGEVRVVYAIGDGLWAGPRVKGPLDARAAPPLDAALGDVFEAAGPRSAELVADVQKALGDRGVALLFERALGAPDKDWDAAYATLAPAAAAEVKAMLAKRLAPGGPTAGLRRAVVAVPLREGTGAPELEARVRELATAGKELAAAGIILRALAARDASRAANLGCELVSKKEAAPPPEHDSLVEAASLAIAAEVGRGRPLACDGVASALGDEPCMPYFRCAAGAPVSFSQASDQNEPLCTKGELGPVIARELERPPAEVLAGGPRAPLFAFAALAMADRLPEAFAQAHARRRFTLTQPKEPACDSGVRLNTPCHCDEAMLRDLACRNLGASSAHVGLCKFEIDEKQRKISNVSAAMEQ